MSEVFTKQKPTAGTVSVREIAQRVGVSPATVSLALTGRRPTSYVSASTRRIVQDAARELGYPLDRLRSQRPWLERVAVFMHKAINPVYSQTALELCRVLNAQQTQMLIHLVQADDEADAAALDLQRRQEIDAVVLIGSRQTLLPVDIPCVYVGETPPGSQVWQARTNNEGGGRAVGEYLWTLGHRSLATLGLSEAQPAGARRLHGLQTFLREQGTDLSPTGQLFWDAVSDTEADLHERVAAFVAENRCAVSPVTAVFCYNDWVAAKLLLVLRDLNIRVPEQLSVVGFDDSVYAQLLDPPLTTVHHPFEALGALAAELLLEQGEMPEAAPHTRLAPCRLVARHSCARLERNLADNV